MKQANFLSQYCWHLSSRRALVQSLCSHLHTLISLYHSRVAIRWQQSHRLSELIQGGQSLAVATSMTTSLSTGSGSIPSRERCHWLETMTTSPRSRNTSRRWPSRRRTRVPSHPWSWCGSWNRSMNPVQASISTKAAHGSLSGSLNGCLDPSASLTASPSSWPRMRQRRSRFGSSSKPTPLRGTG